METLEKVKQALLAMQRYSWEQGVTAQAFLELGEMDLVLLLAKDAINRQAEDGRLALMRPNEGVTDPAANGEAIWQAARLTGDPLFENAAQKMLDYLLHRAPRLENGVFWHVIDQPQCWVDSLYMSPPFLAIVGCFEEAIRQIEGIRQLLWDPDARLFSQIWDGAARAFVRKDQWGVGNGWAAAGITRVIRSLPASMESDRQRIIGYVRQVIDGCLARQRPDGLFHNVVDHPETFVETNLAQMLAYSIYRGLQGGWLDENYREAADRMRSAAWKKVDSEGLVQGVCGAPEFDHPGTAPEGQAFFLLMEAAAG